MQITADTLDLKPPRPGRWSMPLVLALVAHALLIGALTWGVHWQTNPEPVSFEAELWSAVAQRAAPRAVEPPPSPPVREPKVKPEPKPEPKPQPDPKPEPKPEPKVEPPAPDTRAADIATAQAKKKKIDAEKRAAEEKARKEKAEKEKIEKEKEKKAEAAEKAEKAEKAKQDKLEKAKKLAADQKAKAEAKAQRDQAAAEATEKLRAENMRRMMGQAGATGGANAKGTALRDSGPSAGYAGRVNAAIRPNVLLTEDIPGNPKAEIEVRSAPDGTVISRRLARSSGNAAWDKAALAAIDRTGKLPRDVDGRVPSPMILEMRPRD